MPVNQRPDEAESLDGVNRVVLHALSTLAPQGGAEGVIRKPLESFVMQMTHAALDPAPGRLLDVIKSMRRARISSLQIAEGYVPLVARRLGEAWLADQLEFAGVSIGSARLQSLLRQLAPDWGLSRSLHAHSPPAYVVGVPEGCQHTLGASLLAGQLRHRGLSVHLDLEMTPDSMAAQVRDQRYAGVLISASSVDHLETSRKLVECSKNESRDTPVIIGGIVLNQTEDIKTQTGADLVSSDIYDALRHCDISRAALDEMPPYRDPMAHGKDSDIPTRRAAE